MRVFPSLVAVLAVALAASCTGKDSVAPDPTSGAGAAGGAATVGAGGPTSTASTSASGGGGQGGEGGDPGPIAATRCGLQFAWVTSGHGELESYDTPHSTLTVGEADVAKLALALEGFRFNRDPQYETVAHRMLYTTQDRGALIDATALVVEPVVSTPQPFPVLLMHHGTTGLNDTCATTYQLEDDQSDAFGYALVMSLVSSFGYIVVGPDYIGQKSVGPTSPDLHPYLIGEATAIAAWDSMRAADALLANSPSAAERGPIALWGASQGGHGAMFSAIYRPFYAPEYDVVAGVYHVPPANVQAQLTLGVRQFRDATGFAALFFLGANDWYEPDPDPGLSAIFTSPGDQNAPVDAKASCRPDTFNSATDVGDVYVPELITAAQTPTLTNYEPWGCFLREASITETALPAPSVPGLFVLAEDDTLVLTAIERQSFDALCAAGYNLNYLECAGANHEEGFLFAIDDALDYVDARIAGEPLQNTCTQSAPTTCANTP